MKKFLVILMVLAMASFLFVGCVPTTPEEAAEEEAAEEEVAVVKTDTPFITNVGGITSASTSTLTDSAEVDGVGVAGAIIKVYIDGVQSGVGSTGTEGSFSDILVTMIDLEDGVRKAYVTATVPGLAESDKSDEITFTYDTTPPSIASVVADSTSNYIKVTFDEDVVTSTSGTAYVAGKSAMDPTHWTWWYNGGSEQELSDTNCTMSKVSAKCIKITPDTAVPSGGTAFYITLEGGATNTAYDIAGNYNSSAITAAGNTVP